MYTLKDLYYDFKIGRKLEKLDKDLALQDARDLEQAIRNASTCARNNAATVKAMHKTLVKACKTL